MEGIHVEAVHEKLKSIRRKSQKIDSHGRDATLEQVKSMRSHLPEQKEVAETACAELTATHIYCTARDKEVENLASEVKPRNKAIDLEEKPKENHYDSSCILVLEYYSNSV
ncbi:hypothetical protein DUI87_10953 [Hirundo rustica rustica]|uniref:Uncharacterized protein n=1 Tax=Hirundo rustica rustica TaxID=333673 RepID=A0A3M0KK38_HIRRU|nr:hypothetical protein DUI87_10953 [Hirundo rustica rustica]